jgi:hypothetical protein
MTTYEVRKLDRLMQQETEYFAVPISLVAARLSRGRNMLPGHPSNPLARIAFDYLIRKQTGAADETGRLLEVGSDVDEVPSVGLPLADCNLFDEKVSGRLRPLSAQRLPVRGGGQSQCLRVHGRAAHRGDGRKLRPRRHCQEAGCDAGGFDLLCGASEGLRHQRREEQRHSDGNGRAAPQCAQAQLAGMVRELWRRPRLGGAGGVRSRPPASST